MVDVQILDVKLGTRWSRVLPNPVLYVGEIGIGIWATLFEELIKGRWWNRPETPNNSHVVPLFVQP
jgi:hypothetical protein